MHASVFVALATQREHQEDDEGEGAEGAGQQQAA